VPGASALEAVAGDPEIEALVQLGAPANLALRAVERALAAGVQDPDVDVRQRLVEIPELGFREADLETPLGVRAVLAEEVVDQKVLVIDADPESLERSAGLLLADRTEDPV
jgi:hypothetical protein